MKTKDVIKHFGSKKAVAEALGITKQAVSLWGENVPQGRAWQLQVLTGGLLRVS